MSLSRYKRELSAALAYVALLAAVGVVAPSFFGAGNLRDMALNNAPVLPLAVRCRPGNWICRCIWLPV